MTETANPQTPIDPAHAGFLANASGFLSALAGYLHARMELLQMEGKKSFFHVLFALVFVVASLVLLLFFWALLMVGLGLLIFSATWMGFLWSVLWVVLAHAILIGGVFGLTKAGVLTMTVPTAAATLLMWGLMVVLGGGYAWWSFHNAGGVMLVLAGFHILLAATLVWLATARIGKVSLRTTLSELQKDREWLTNLKTQALTKKD